MPLLEIKNLAKKFNHVHAVKKVDLTIQEGQILGLLGPNGAGKSTTILMIASLLNPTDGDILYRGQSILKKPIEIRKELGYVPQEIALYPEFTGYENLQFFAKVYKIPKKDQLARIQDVLEIVELTDKAKQKVQHYSGGMKRRLNIACALLHRPKLLIMDEPTVGIDPQSRNHILEMVKQLNKEGMTILYTSHYMEEVEFLCDTISILDNGEVIASGSKEELVAMIQEQDILTIEVEKTNDNFKQQLSTMNNILHISESEQTYQLSLVKHASILPEIFTRAEHEQVRILSVDVKTPRLEDVFLHLTGRSLRDE